MMLANDDFDIDAEIIRIAENFDHAPDRRVAVLREIPGFRR